MTGQDPTHVVEVGMTGSVGRRSTATLARAACGDDRLHVVDLSDHAPEHLPDVGVVTTLAGGDDQLLATVASAVRAVAGTTTLVLNVDDDRVRDLADDLAAPLLRVSVEDPRRADLAARDVRLDARARARFDARTPWGDAEVALAVAGRHHVVNALCALAVAGVAGSDLTAAVAGLAGADLESGRAIDLDDGLVVLDDTGHATTVSVLAALATLDAMQVTGSRVGVLGAMDGPGETHETEHWRIGMRAARVLDRLVVVGQAAAPITAGARDAGMSRVELVDDVAGALRALADVVAGDAVLVKGGSTTGLDAVVSGLQDHRRAKGTVS